MSSKKKLGDLLSDCNLRLSKSDLKKCKCSSKDIEVLSKSIKDWRAFAHHFKLSKDTIKEIKDLPERFDLGTTVRNKLVLENWVEKVGKKNANFLTLAEACCELHHWNIVEDYIVIECKKLTAIKERATDHLAGRTLHVTCHVEHKAFTEQEDVGSESDSLSPEPSVGLTRLSVSGAQVGTGPGEAGKSESKIPTSNKTPIYFQCQCNSEHGCTYDDYISGKCSGHIKDIFPYLNAEGLSPKEKRQLIDKLCDDTKQIMEEFGQTAIDIFEILEAKQVSLDAIRMQVTAFSVRKSTHMYSDLHEAKSIQDIGSRLLQHKFISFLNYRILEKIVEHFEKQFKDGSLRNRLSEYLGLFEVFCKRSVFEVPVRTFKDNSPDSDTKFVVKVSKDYFSEKVAYQEATFQAERNHESDSEFTMRHLFDVRRNIQRVIGLMDSIVDFVCGVEKGCVEITFCLLSSVDPEVLPFSTEQVRQLLQIGIRVIHQNPSKLTTVTAVLPTTHQKRADTNIKSSALKKVSETSHSDLSRDLQTEEDQELEKATFGAGCFWCVEAIFLLVKGVELVESGYSGGHVENPTYKQVRSGDTGHAEVIRIHFDPKKISYEQLLDVLWHTHDPTTLNRQGIDVGTQYRSVIFYHNERQREIAERSLKNADESGLWDDPIVTTVEPLKNYYQAEDYHQNYFERNPSDGDCENIIEPKVKKFKKEYPHLLKDTSTRNRPEL